MLLIWGWRTRLTTLAEGVFHCPGCGGDRHYARRQARNWFTLFFVPVIPLKVLGTFVEFQTCRQGYDERILLQPTSADLQAQLAGAAREAAVRMLRIDDSPTARAAAMAAISQASDDEWTDAKLDADIRLLDTGPLPTRLRQLGEVMNEHGKERFLTSITLIAAGGGVLDDASRRALGEMARDLGMTAAHARGVMDAALDPTGH